MGCDTLVALAPATRDGVTLFAKNSDRPARECQRLDNTTAALVAALPADPSTPLVAWVCLGSPCTSAFLPCYLDGRVPAALACGGAEPEAASPWWRLRELLSVVERDFARFGPPVRARWDAFETTVAEEARALEAAATSRRRRGEKRGGPPHELHGAHRRDLPRRGGCPRPGDGRAGRVMTAVSLAAPATGTEGTHDVFARRGSLRGQVPSPLPPRAA